MKNLDIKDAKQLIYGYIKNQIETDQSIRDNLFYGWLFCPTYKKKMERIDLTDISKADHEFYELKSKITEYYLCRNCKEAVHYKKCLYVPIHKYMEKFGYSHDCHGYHKTDQIKKSEKI